MCKAAIAQQSVTKFVGLLVFLGTLHPSAGVFGQARLMERPVLYTAPGLEQVSVRSEVGYKAAGGQELTMDLFYPPSSDRSRRLPAVIFVFGYSDSAAMKVAGAPLRSTGAYTSWAKLIAASGLLAVTYGTTQPEADLADLIRYLQTNAEELGVDAARIGLWACSGNVPVALSYLMRDAGGTIKAGTFYYGFMTTSDGYQAALVDSLAQQVGFAVPILRPDDRLRTDVPVLVVRAGRDNVPGVRPSIDHFAQLALSNNTPLTLINYPAGQHGFDLLDDAPLTREFIRQTVAFLLTHLQASDRLP